MKSINQLVCLFAAFLLTAACATSKKGWLSQVPAYSPASKELYDTIAHMDSVWQDSYNNCKMEVQEQLFSENLEFYHDKTGLMTSKAALINALKNNICGKVTRELLQGSIEVYPIGNYGAVEMGYHRFHNIRENSTSHFAKFVHIWRREDDGQWRITRVISLH
ncbi:MAG TPA: nuclear transport factor 2 family protein [Chitinophaga sp.]|uniref:nuclear transport factor 2 family protein n=1 Tax=Chitinophaga sp. TaxID=1869181 RepID=UPI002DBAAF2B|nr:nuclear transport factor 2 family protein [Chitinophaga sp.]HEU4554603.1 nuclear transport factor 2 family protein [Chitinophaga sp.]